MATTTIRTRVLEVGTAAVGVRIADHHAPAGIYLDCTGVTQAAPPTDAALTDICAATGMTVVAIDGAGRALGDVLAQITLCERAARWTAASAKHEQGTEHLVIGGIAGPASRVAAATLVRLALRPAALPFTLAPHPDLSPAAAA